MNKKDSTNIFEEPEKAFSARIPEVLIKELTIEAKKNGRSQNKQLIAVLAERYGIIKETGKNK